MTARKITVLLVEDDFVVREALQHALTVENYHVLTASSPDDAAHHLKDGKVHVVLIDSCLSNRDGGHFLHQVTERYPLLSTIAMTADNSRISSWPGISARVEKPLDLPDLFGKIEELAGSARQPSGAGKDRR